jgi:autotransporter-associated beta strand protein
VILYSSRRSTVQVIIALCGSLLLATHRGEAQFTNKVTTTPVIIQDGNGPSGDDLPYDGLEYCCPTAVSMSLSYLGVDGFNQIGSAAPTAASELNLVEVMAGLMDTDPINGTAYISNMTSAIETYLAAKGISSSSYSLTTTYSPTLGELSALNQTGTVVDLICGYYNNDDERIGGHCISLLSQGVNAQGQSSSNTLVIQNPEPGALAPFADTSANSLQYLNTTATPSGLSGDGALEMDPNQYPGYLGSTAVIETALALTVNTSQLSGSDPAIAPWNLSSTQTIDLQNGDLTVLAPIEGSGGILKGDQGFLELEAADTSTGANTVVSGTLRSDIASGLPFGTGSMQLQAGSLDLVPAAGSGAVSLAVAGGSNSALNFAYGSTLELNRNGNSSLAVTIGGYTDSSTANFARLVGSYGTMVIAPAGGTAGLGTLEQVIVNGSGGNLPPLTNGIVAPFIVGQNNASGASGDFLTYGSGGFAKASYVEATATAITAAGANAVYDADTAQTISSGVTAEVYALRVGAETVGGGSFDSTLEVGPQTTGGEAGVILNSGTINATYLDFGAAEGLIYASNAGGAVTSIIEGSGGLTVFGPGTLTLSGVNGYSGPTHINSGTVDIQNSTTGSGVITVETNATLEINAASTAGGSGGISLQSGATLRLNGGTAAGMLTANAGSFILGSGTISGPGTFSGTIGSPATDPFAAAFGGVENIDFTNSTTFTGTTIYSWRLDALSSASNEAGTFWSLLDFTTKTGTVDLGSESSPFHFTLDLGVADPNSGNAFWNSSHEWLTAYDASGFNEIWYYYNFASFAQGSFYLTNDSNYTELYVDYVPTSVPEPGTPACLVTAAAVLAVVHRRNSRPRPPRPAG